MKRLLTLLTLGVVFCLIAGEASAQMNFTNNTPCWIRARGWYTNTAPCVGPTYCASPWVSVPPFGAVVIPGGPCGGIPGPPSFYRRLQHTDGMGGFVTIDYCTFPAANYFDCQNFPRGTQFVGLNNAVTF